MNIKVITAGKCMICGREIKIVTKRNNDKFPNVFFCRKCDPEPRVNKKQGDKWGRNGGYR